MASLTAEFAFRLVLSSKFRVDTGFSDGDYSASSAVCTATMLMCFDLTKCGSKRASFGRSLLLSNITIIGPWSAGTNGVSQHDERLP